MNVYPTLSVHSPDKSQNLYFKTDELYHIKQQHYLKPHPTHLKTASVTNSNPTTFINALVAVIISSVLCVKCISNSTASRH